MTILEQLKLYGIHLVLEEGDEIGLGDPVVATKLMKCNGMGAEIIFVPAGTDIPTKFPGHEVCAIQEVQCLPAELGDFVVAEVDFNQVVYPLVIPAAS